MIGMATMAYMPATPSINGSLAHMQISTPQQSDESCALSGLSPVVDLAQDESLNLLGFTNTPSVLKRPIGIPIIETCSALMTKLP